MDNNIAAQPTAIDDVLALVETVDSIDNTSMIELCNNAEGEGEIDE